MRKAVPYELRHTASSLLADLGVDAETRAEICGHSEAVNRSVYTKMSLEAKRAAMDKLGPLFPDLAMADKGQDKGTEGPKPLRSGKRQQTNITGD